ncbi:GntR family transcriptional regulator [Neorhizobium lilium]|uniref:GntR family transcriptional regulator n=1 Tax=Neorhizobium lilium TaxID=2503024 RepID=A0A3S3SBC8_9HYPH|nr:GntR family transcriptional regulator [Neorhizobium lilium]RWX81685.1 GntR family transcriptional regulator [Neorhizobium lilium]
MLDRQSPFLPRNPNDIATLAEQRILSDIVSGKLLPGQRLSEQSLCRNYKFGRGIIRTVLSRLSHREFVISHARSGWRVVPVTAIGLREITLGRRQLEPLLAEVDLFQRDIERIEAICDMQAAIASHTGMSADRLSLLRRYEREILDILAGQIKAPVIAGWLANLWDRSEYYLNFLEAAAPMKLKPADWSVYIDAKKAGRIKDAAAFIRKTGDAFAAFTQAQLLQSDLEMPVARKPRKRTAVGEDLSSVHSTHPPATSKRIL